MAWHQTATDTLEPVRQPLQDLLPGREGLIVRLMAHPGRRPALLDALHRYADELLDAEPQTEAFVVCLDPQEANAVWLFEWFTGPDGQQRHRESNPFGILVDELSQVLSEEPQVLPLEPLRMHINPQSDPEVR
jgi:quinol monooxygenase YgiN